MRDAVLFPLCVVALLALFSGCTSAPRPKIIVKEVKIPVICPVKMPKKPENSGDFESHKALMIYLLECEALLKHCATPQSHFDKGGI